MDKPVRFVRIYFSETDRGPRGTLKEYLFEHLRRTHQVHGVTVFRGIAGFGQSGESHASDLLRLSADLPLVLEFFDAPERVEAALQDIRPLIKPGHLVSWDAFCNC